ncbi:DUF2330 domain-containing protein [bacterium]|nr:DUF2330 domain-containing protein [bacterium]
MKRLGAFVLLVSVLLPAAAVADGFYIPEVTRKLPDIPPQHAVLSWKGGVETLVVESTLDGEGSSFGWIIPVPSSPRSLEKVSPGLLRTLSFQIQPKLIHPRHVPRLFGVDFRIIMVGMMAAGCLIVLLYGFKGVMYSLVLLMLPAILLPNFLNFRHKAASSAGSVPTVSILKRETVGSYEVTVLEAERSAELSEWLRNRGFSDLPGEAAPIIEEYIADGWVFVVARLLREGIKGASTPHPILMEFEAEELVYPMKLTAVSGSPVYLEIFVVTDKTALPVEYDIAMEFSDVFRWEDQVPKFSTRRSYGIAVNDTERTIEGFQNVSLGPYKAIAHADAPKVMWDGCTVTKLAGMIDPSQMMKDLTFRLEGPLRHRGEVYSAEGRDDRAMEAAFAWLILGLPLVTVAGRFVAGRKNLRTNILLLLGFTVVAVFIYYQTGGVIIVALSTLLFAMLCLQPRPEKGVGRWQALAIAGLLTILSGVTAAVYSREYRAAGEVVEVHLSRRGAFREFMGCLNAHYAEWYGDEKNFIERLGESGCLNPFTDDPLLLEDSPGNITVSGKGGLYEVFAILENGAKQKIF